MCLFHPAPDAHISRFLGSRAPPCAIRAETDEKRKCGVVDEGSSPWVEWPIRRQSKRMRKLREIGRVVLVVRGTVRIQRLDDGLRARENLVHARIVRNRRHAPHGVIGRRDEDDDPYASSSYPLRFPIGHTPTLPRARLGREPGLGRTDLPGNLRLRRMRPVTPSTSATHPPRASSLSTPKKSPGRRAHTASPR